MSLLISKLLILIGTESKLIKSKTSNLVSTERLMSYRPAKVVENYAAATGEVHTSHWRVFIQHCNLYYIIYPPLKVLFCITSIVILRLLEKASCLGDISPSMATAERYFPFRVSV